MKGKIISVVLYSVGVLVLTFALGFLIGSRPSQCATLGQKAEVMDSFCSDIINRAIAVNCPSELSAQDMSACQQIVALQAGQACFGMVGRGDIQEMIDEGC